MLVTKCTLAAVLAVGLAGLVACDDKKNEGSTATPTSTLTPTPAPTPSATPSATPAASASASAPGTARFAVAMGKGTFLIDAPLEKIKGMSDEVRGNLDIDAKDLTRSRGSIMVRLSTLKTSTFGDADKDAAQTEHARNWMEVGPESSAATRMKHEWATLAISSLECAPGALADAKEDKGARVVKAKVTGTFTAHGVTSAKSAIPVTVTFKGPADAPTEITIKTEAPMPVSLKEHDIKPRDAIGGFLNGALDRIGKKIDDKVQVSFEATAKVTMPEHP
jgi:polyisoprenoid-binding protein YceI